MKIAINGIGVAGPAVAWWLKEYGHEPVLFEIAPELRRGGYVIDFWGVGYDIVEKMGLLEQVRERGYQVEELKVVGSQGQKVAGINIEKVTQLIDNRFVSLARSDVSAALFNACINRGIEARFETSVVGAHEMEESIQVEISDGTTEEFDLLIGADGVHSQVREAVFGPHKKFEQHVGYHVAAFELDGYEPRDELAYVMHRSIGRSISRFAMSGGKTLLLFVFRSDLMERFPKNEAEEKAALKAIFADVGWEAPQMLERMQEVEDVYFDTVSQVHMPQWYSGRTALIGDAAACASLLAGEGTGLAITEAYVLAGELHKANGNYVKAFPAYDQALRSFIEGKQKTALSSASFFAPKSSLGQFIGNMGIRLSNIPWLANLIVVNGFQDDIELPEYK